MAAIKIAKAYKPLYTSNARFFVITGGRGSGKSFAVGNMIMNLTFEPNHKILYTRYTMSTANTSIIPEFKEKIDLVELQDRFLITKSEIMNLDTGCEIMFRGIKTSSGNQTANLKSLTGVTTWVVDEAEELTDEVVFDKIAMSVRKKGVQNRIILMLNPSTKEHWIYKKFFEERGVAAGFNGTVDDVTYIHTSYLDNIANLDEAFLKDVERLKEKNPAKFEHVIMGGWLNAAEGVVYTNWEYGDYQDIGATYYGQDFGFSVDPTVLIQSSVDKRNKIIYVKELYRKAGMTTTDIYLSNEYHTGNKGLIVADNAEPRLIAELKAMGNNMRECVKGAGSITAGIALLQDYKIIVDKKSTALGAEFNNYVWDDKKSGTPVDAYNHGLDALRYAVYSNYKSSPMIMVC